MFVCVGFIIKNSITVSLVTYCVFDFVFFLFLKIIDVIRVPTAQAKQGKWSKQFSVRENTGTLENLPKCREFCFLDLELP